MSPSGAATFSVSHYLRARHESLQHEFLLYTLYMHIACSATASNRTTIGGRKNIIFIACRDLQLPSLRQVENRGIGKGKCIILWIYILCTFVGAFTRADLWMERRFSFFHRGDGIYDIICLCYVKTSANSRGSTLAFAFYCAIRRRRERESRGLTRSSSERETVFKVICV